MEQTVFKKRHPRRKLLNNLDENLGSEFSGNKEEAFFSILGLEKHAAPNDDQCNFEGFGVESDKERTSQRLSSDIVFSDNDFEGFDSPPKGRVKLARMQDVDRAPQRFKSRPRRKQNLDIKPMNSPTSAQFHSTVTIPIRKPMVTIPTHSPMLAKATLTPMVAKPTLSPMVAKPTLSPMVAENPAESDITSVSLKCVHGYEGRMRPRKHTKKKPLKRALNRRRTRATKPSVSVKDVDKDTDSAHISHQLKSFVEFGSRISAIIDDNLKQSKTDVQTSAFEEQCLQMAERLGQQCPVKDAKVQYTLDLLAQHKSNRSSYKHILLRNFSLSHRRNMLLYEQMLNLLQCI